MDLVAAIATFLSVPLFLAGFAWYAIRARRRGSGQSLMGPFEEIWDPATRRANIEIQREAAKAPGTPSPGDPPTPSWRYLKTVDRPDSPPHQGKDT